MGPIPRGRARACWDRAGRRLEVVPCSLHSDEPFLGPGVVCVCACVFDCVDGVCVACVRCGCGCGCGCVGVAWEGQSRFSRGCVSCQSRPATPSVTVSRPTARRRSQFVSTNKYMNLGRLERDKPRVLYRLRFAAGGCISICDNPTVTKALGGCSTLQGAPLHISAKQSQHTAGWHRVLGLLNRDLAGRAIGNSASSRARPKWRS